MGRASRARRSGAADAAGYAGEEEKAAVELGGRAVAVREKVRIGQLYPATRRRVLRRVRQGPHPSALPATTLQPSTSGPFAEAPAATVAANEPEQPGEHAAFVRGDAPPGDCDRNGQPEKLAWVQDLGQSPLPTTSLQPGTLGTGVEARAAVGATHQMERPGDVADHMSDGALSGGCGRDGQPLKLAWVLRLDRSGVVTGVVETVVCHRGGTAMELADSGAFLSWWGF
mmetsp:Transcript_112341/g.322971  ORF Transcript_112341/g.322971 Transcript_112341/m.322971 type:complete len:228 (-) Transcript_112341:14-697(-)